MYEQQDPDQEEFNLRGKFVTGDDGSYAFYCLRPTPYPVPDDGPGGALLKKLDRHPYRPAHIHFIVRRASLFIGWCSFSLTPGQVLREGYKPLTTQIFDAESKYLESDSVFAVKDSLVVRFTPRTGDPSAESELKYDVMLAPTSS